MSAAVQDPAPAAATPPARRGLRRGLPRTAAAPRGAGTGLLWPLSVVMASGVLAVAFADRAAREGRPAAQALFWAGVTLILVPAAARLATSAARRGERLGLALLAGLGCYLVKVAYNPARLSFSDESIHLRSVLDDLHSGRLFSFNPLLPEAAHYPGLGGIESGLVRLTGLPVSSAGMVVIGSARLLLVLVIFHAVERLSGSARVAGLSCLLYGANPNFLYWSAQVSYESLALPLVAFTLYLALRRSEPGASRRLAVLAAAGVLAVVATHHLSSYFLAAVLWAWSAVVLARRRFWSVRGERSPLALAVLATAAIGVWLAELAPITGQYLGSIAASTSTGLFNVITGASAARKLFAAGAQVPPAWERLLGIGAVALTLAGLLAGAWLIWRGRRTRAALLAPLALALIYPVLLPLRFIGSAAETANRSTEFLYMGVGTVVAVAIFSARPRGRLPRRVGPVLAVVAASVIVLGGVAVSWQYAERLPQSTPAHGVPYELDQSAISADVWAKDNLGRGRRFASDFLDHLGLATYGAQRPLWAPVDGVSAWEVMAPPRIDAAVRSAVARGRIEYVLVEDRLLQGIPASGFYFDKGEPGSVERKRPLDPRALQKFALAPGVSRLYDNGQQQIYSLAGVG